MAEYTFNPCDMCERTNCKICIFHDLIIKSIEAEHVKHGRWDLHDDGSGTCDQCHFTQKNVWDDDNWQNYCGVCGADMRKRRKNNG